MKAFWTYTLSRLGVLAATYVVLWAICWPWLERTELTNLVVLFSALLISSLISMVVLSGQRQRLADHVRERAERVSQRIEESRSAEDVD